MNLSNPLSRELLSAIDAAISQAAGRFRTERASAVTGGCIHHSYLLEGRDQRYFAKTNRHEQLATFDAEAEGLAALSAAGVRVPAPVCHGEYGDHAFLVLEYLELNSDDDHAELGRMLARMHAVRGDQFGWTRDNFIGATPQRNPYSDSWCEFWREQRLLPQIALAENKGLGKTFLTAGERLASALPQLLSDHRPAPSLLHGDLWSGNAGFLSSGAPVLFDPAVYYGDRETDLAMTELFGGFSPAFYRACEESAPLATGYALRKTLYNLYHVLNHANLFGGAYVAQALRMMESLLAEIEA